MSPSSTSSSDRDPSKAVRALLFAAALLLAAELTLFALESTRDIPPGMPEGPLLHINLGTSRTLRGLMPLQMERELEALSSKDAWIANATQRGRTMIGLAQLYEEEIAPRIHPRHRLGRLAIEVRGGSMNDTHLASRETRFALKIYATRRALSLGETLESWFRELRIADLSRALESQQLGFPEWATGTQGWLPFTGTRRANLAQHRMRSSYTKILRNYSLGARQTDALRYLIGRAREDGWTPVLYTMPITLLHRSFYGPGEYEAFLLHGARVAKEEGVAWIDLATALPFDQSYFWDTHHLDRDAARRLSHCFARVVLHEPLRGEAGPIDPRNLCVGSGLVHRPLSGEKKAPRVR